MRQKPLALAPLLVALLAAGAARAAVYAPIPDDELASRSAAFALVRAGDSRAVASPGGLPETRTLFTLLEAVRGSVPAELEVGVPGGALDDGLELVVTGVPRFEAGRTYLLALSARGDGLWAVSELSLGAFDVVRDGSGASYATRMAFRGASSNPIFPAAGTLTREPLRDLAAFKAHLAALPPGSRASWSAVPSYVAPASEGPLTPVRAGGVSALWDDSWCPDGTPGRQCAGARPARWANGAKATVFSCNEDPSFPGQSGVIQGMTAPSLDLAVSLWTGASHQGTSPAIGYARGTDRSSGCDPNGYAQGQVIVYLNDLSQFGGVAVPCVFPGGLLGIGAWLTNNQTHPYKGQTFATVLAGLAWVRKFSCIEGSFRTDLFQNVLTHVLGNTLGLGESDVSRNPWDTNPYDDALAVMVSSYPNYRAVGLGTDDVDAACFLYGPCGPAVCPVPEAPVLSGPERVTGGQTLCLSWTPIGGLEPQTDEYEVEIARDASFTSLVHVYREKRTFLPAPTARADVPASLYARVRVRKQCPGEGEKDSVVSNVVAVAVEPTGAVVTAAAGGPNWTVVAGGPAPAARVPLTNSGTAGTLVTLQAAGGFLDVSPALLSLAAGATAEVTVTARTAAVASAGFRTGTLTANAAGTALTLPVTLDVLPSVAAPASGSTLSASSRSLTFSAPKGETPATQTVTFTVTPPPAGRSVTLALAPDAPLPPWLTLSAPGGSLEVPASGALTLTFGVDRSRRTPSDGPPPQRGFVLFRLAGAPSGSTDVLVDLLDVEPVPVTANAGPTRGGGTSFVIPSVVEGDGAQGATYSTDGWLRNI